MKLKLILNVLFEKKKVLFLFFAMCLVLIVFTSLQTIFILSEKDSIASMPDFVFNGTNYNSEDGSYPFIWYNGIGDFSVKASEIAGNEADCYNMVYRSLYNYYDELSSVGFFGAVYGMSDECIVRNIAPYIAEGSIPTRGKKEAVIGYYFAKRFDIGIGDPIPQAITLSPEWNEDDIDSYVVCGILDENVTEYFNGSAVISRDTFEAMNGVVEDNMIMGYYNDSSRYDEIFMEMNAVREGYRVPEGKLNYKQKEFSEKKLAVNICAVMVMSMALLTMLVSYLMKGITPKVGLLKAIGVSTHKILVSFLMGIFSVFTLALGAGIGVALLVVNTMNKYVSTFYKFQVHLYQFTEVVMLIDLLLFAFIVGYVFVVTFFKCKAVSPKVAMTKTI